MFREICAHIANTVSVFFFPNTLKFGPYIDHRVPRYPNSKFPAIGAFIFLRFVIPHFEQHGKSN